MYTTEIVLSVAALPLGRGLIMINVQYSTQPTRSLSRIARISSYRRHGYRRHDVQLYARPDHGRATAGAVIVSSLSR
ncbi:hypothetical protein OH77DRAFT_408921 [Trametes cingulata]|nr:hypothetical protein OH77DRAFT_408921 [Trametes cingulata]